MASPSGLLLVLNDISGCPRPLRALIELSRRNYQMDILSWQNSNDIDGYFREHFVIVPGGGNIIRKMSRIFMNSIKPLLRFQRINRYIINYVYGISKYESIFNRYDFLLVADIELLPIVAGINKQYKLIFDLREYYPAQVENEFIFSILEKPYRNWVCNTFLHRCDYLYTVSRGLADRYSSTFGVKVDIIKSVPYFEFLSANIVNINNVKLVHHGIANANRNLEDMIYLIDQLDNRFSLDLYLTGSQKVIQKLTYIANQYSNVRIMPPVSFKMIIKTLNRYDIGIFYNNPSTFNLRHSLPNKLFEFIQARLAVAIGPSPDMAEVVREYNCGIVANEFTISEMAAVLNALTEEDIMMYKRNSHKASKELNYEQESIKLNAIIDETLAL